MAYNSCRPQWEAVICAREQKAGNWLLRVRIDSHVHRRSKATHTAAAAGLVFPDLLFVVLARYGEIGRSSSEAPRYTPALRNGLIRGQD